MQDLLEFLDSIALALALSIFGALTYASEKGRGGFWDWLSKLTGAAFAGVISYIIIIEFLPVSDRAAAAISGACAGMGRDVLQKFVDKLLDALTYHR